MTVNIFLFIADIIKEDGLFVLNVIRLQVILLSSIVFPVIVRQVRIVSTAEDLVILIQVQPVIPAIHGVKMIG
jgi:hypothetical protein